MNDRQQHEDPGEDETPAACEVRDQIGQQLFDLRDYKAAESILRLNLSIRERTIGIEHSDTLMNLIQVAILLQSQGKSSEAEPLFRRALAVRERTLGPEHSDTLECMSYLSGQIAMKGDWAEAERIEESVVQGLLATLGPDHPHTIVTKDWLAIIRRKLAEGEQGQ